MLLLTSHSSSPSSCLHFSSRTRLRFAPRRSARSDRIIKEVPTYRVISQSTLIDRMKINGSLARRAIAFLEKEGLIKRVVHHNAQLVYTRATAAKE